ncbi:MAG: hypothetical protein JXA68_10825 [Ignavibacteriales bacterium]|nr:hypothetical protein [Ignavibacteriales bacterium]
MPKTFLLLSIFCLLSILFIPDFIGSENNPYLWILGIVLFLNGTYLLIRGRNLLIQYGKMERNNFIQTSVVVKRKLFAIIRHPQYLGLIFILLGLICSYQNWIDLDLGIVGISLISIQAVKEEKYCSTLLGDDYNDYCQLIPRFNFITGVIKVIERKTY